jgi:hypothetical protein
MLVKELFIFFLLESYFDFGLRDGSVVFRTFVRLFPKYAPRYQCFIVFYSTPENASAWRVARGAWRVARGAWRVSVARERGA